MRPAGLPAKPRVTPPSAAAIGNLELAVLRRLDGLLQGDYAGLLPGPGSDTGEARPYVAGDDTRHIDWAVTARTDAAARPRHDLRPRARAVARRRRVEEPRLRHRRGPRSARSSGPPPGAFALLASPRRQPRRRRCTTAVDSSSVPRSLDRTPTSRPSSRRSASPLSTTAPTTPVSAKRSAEVVAVASRRGLVVVLSDFLGSHRLGARDAGARTPSRRDRGRGRRPTRAAAS